LTLPLLPLWLQLPCRSAARGVAGTAGPIFTSCLVPGRRKVSKPGC